MTLSNSEAWQCYMYTCMYWGIAVHFRGWFGKMIYWKERVSWTFTNRHLTATVTFFVPSGHSIHSLLFKPLCKCISTEKITYWQWPVTNQWLMRSIYKTRFFLLEKITKLDSFGTLFVCFCFIEWYILTV